MAEGAHRQEVDGDHADGGQGRDAPVRQVGNAHHQNQYPQQQHIQSSVKPGAKSPLSLVGIRKSAVTRVLRGVPAKISTKRRHLAESSLSQVQACG
jgi:hypothetical protein